MIQTEISVLRWLLMEIRRECFEDDTAVMAEALGFPDKEVENALSNERARSKTDIFERSAKYCLNHNIGLDGMLKKYPFLDALAQEKR